MALSKPARLDAKRVTRKGSARKNASSAIFRLC
jgi:hypothetical protein